MKNNKIIQWFLKHSLTIVSCVLITGLGIVFLVWSSPGTTTIGEDVDVSGTISEGGTLLSDKYLGIPPSSTWGDFLFRGETAWTRLGAGTPGQFLKTPGAGVDPEWDTVSTTYARTATKVVCASDSLDTTNCDYVCDGVNDHLEIQAALNALPATGGEVFLLDGTYNIEVSLVLDSYQTLRGCGRNTILTTTTADLDIITATGGAGSEKVGILIADLCIDGAAGGVANDEAIVWTYVDYSKIRNIWCQNNGHEGIELAYCEFNEITGVTGLGNGSDCIYLYPSSNHNIISGNNSSGDDTGVDILESHHNTISGNNFSGGDGYGVYMWASHGNTISGNTCSGNKEGVGIAIDDCHDNTISGNTVEENQYGIWLTGSSKNIISGNIVGKNDFAGFQLTGSSHHNIISGNNCQVNSQLADNGHDNIYVKDSDYNLIADNLCRAPTIGTTLTADALVGETEIAVTNVAGFEVGMGVVIDLGGPSLEYQRISAISGGAPGVITVDAELTRLHEAGETIGVPEARYGINISNDACDRNCLIGNDLYDSGKTGDLNDVPTTNPTLKHDNRDLAGTGWLTEQ